MDEIRDCIECINYHWIVMVLTGLYTHLRQICIIGFCFADESASPFIPTWSSLLFMFSVLSLLGEHYPWPDSLKKPPIFLIYIYEMIIAALVQNLATRAVWIPLVNSIMCLNMKSGEILMWFNSYMGLDNYSIIAQAAHYMLKDDAVDHMSLCMSILSLVWMLDATESLEEITEIWNKIKNTTRLFNKKHRNNKRITFEDPEVTDWFFYDTSRQSNTKTSYII